MTNNRNLYAEDTFLGLCIVDPKTAVREGLNRGLLVDDFGWDSSRVLWSTIRDIWEKTGGVDGQLLLSTLRQEGNLDKIGGPSKIDQLCQAVVGIPIKPALYIEMIIDGGLRRAADAVANILKQELASGEDGQASVGVAMSHIEKVLARYGKMRNPPASNPADELEGSEAWSTATGLGWWDSLIRLTSGWLHFLGGDPGSGKTSLMIHVAAYNARHGIPVHIISAETDALEIQLSMLTLTKEVPARFVDDIRYNVASRTPENIQKIRELWDTHYGDLPIHISKVDSGADEVIGLIASLTEKTLVLVDHAFAIVAQTEMSAGMKEHQQFLQFFARLLSAVYRGNHICVVANQYTKEGRKETRRGPDAQYGGSGVQNVASSMTHLRNPGSEYANPSGYKAVNAEVVKVRNRLVVDQDGNLVDPLGKDVTFYIDTRYRLVVDKVPVLMPSAE